MPSPPGDWGLPDRFPGKNWSGHFEFARAASTFKIQRLGNEAGLPTIADIEAVNKEFAISA